MPEVTSFPLPADVDDEERSSLREALARHTRIVAEDASNVRFEGAQIGQTGPVHHLQYIRLYRLGDGFLAIAHDLREGMKVSFAKTSEELPATFTEPTVREFVEDELRYRGVISSSARA